MDEKGNLLEIYENMFESFEKISSENWLKCIIYAYFSKDFVNHALIFRAFGRKTKCWDFEKILKIFDENSIEKLNFLFLFLLFFSKIFY